MDVHLFQNIQHGQENSLAVEKLGRIKWTVAPGARLEIGNWRIKEANKEAMKSTVGKWRMVRKADHVVQFSERDALLTLISSKGQLAVCDDKPYKECMVVKNQ